MQTLHQQAEQLGVLYEIIVIDDDSEPRFKHQNSSILRLRHVSYRELDENIGRAAIRNLLAEQAKNPYLLFMDCDAEVIDADFLNRYLACCSDKKGENVVCYGGRLYSHVLQDPNWHLRWLYGIKRECPAAAIRAQHPNRSFITFNFLISKSIFSQLQFDTELVGYGHEDTLFGYALTQHQITVQHLDNPLIHIGLEDSYSFIKKTENGVKNLLFLYKKTKYNKKLVEDIKLLRYFVFLEHFYFKKIIKLAFQATKTCLLRHLHGKNPKLVYFDVYKLGFMCSL